MAVDGNGRAFRYGGEEFTIVFAGKDVASAAVYLEVLRNNIESNAFIVRHNHRPKHKPNQKSKTPTRQKKIKVTVSIGVAENQTHYNSPQDVMKQADKILYKAKKKGRNRVER
jgi:diguanylate cyclase (GGDEF)-like protein